MKPIAIFCHWRSGSSLLSRALNLCGMHTGNEATGWSEECEAQCEHGGLNTVGDRLYHVGIQDAGVGKIEGILTAYKKEAIKNGWAFYGVKFTHILQERCWKYIYPEFKKHWPDAKYIVQIRHPLGVILSLKKAKAALRDPPTSWITDEEIIDSWMSTSNAIKELSKDGALILIYPDVFLTKQIQEIVKRIGMRWNKKANIFKKTDFSVYSKKELLAFKKKYPEADAMFEELSGYAKNI